MKTTEAGIYGAASTCLNKVQFITTGMSLREAVFRILISNGNQPMVLGDIVDQLKEHWGAEYPQRIESTASLQRVLDNPNEYHIARVSGVE